VVRRFLLARDGVSELVVPHVAFRSFRRRVFSDNRLHWDGRPNAHTRDKLLTLVRKNIRNRTHETLQVIQQTDTRKKTACVSVHPIFQVVGTDQVFKEKVFRFLGILGFGVLI